MAGQKSFIDLIDRLVLRAIVGGITRFDQILLSLPGVYPSTALESLHRLVSTEKVIEKILIEATKLTSSRQSKDLRSRYPNSENKQHLSLPVPHPLDYSWRFGDKAINYLLEKCLELTTPTDSVILLGAPSVLGKALERSYPRKMILFEEDQAVTDFFIKIIPKDFVVRCDLTRDVLPQVTGRAVICDSPWYVEYVMSFLWSACQLCTKDGYILLSMPPLGTRPNVSQELVKILEWANQLGFKLIKIEHGVLPYISPPFERNALRAEGLYNIPEEWRCSNLALFIREHEAEISRPPQCSIDSNWTEEVFHGIRIRFRYRQDIDGFADPSLRRIIPGDILPSVSRMDERRKLADVWTSGNRIFECWAPSLLREILKAIVADRLSEKTISEHLGRQLSQLETKLVIKASDQIGNIIKTEKKEYVTYQEDS